MSNFSAAMKFVGEINGHPVYWAEPGRFTTPGVYYWDGKTNVHVPLPAPSPTAKGEEAFEALRAANEARQKAWTNGEAVSLLFRATELGGECGEVLNVCKKIERERRGWRGSRATIEDLADELADVVICADLLALTEGIDLNAAVVRKFNATSEKVGLPHRLAARRSSDSSAEIERQEKHRFGSPPEPVVNPSLAWCEAYAEWYYGRDW